MNTIFTLSETVRKVLVALIGIPLLLVMIFQLDPIALYAFFTLISGIALYEFFSMLNNKIAATGQIPAGLITAAGILYVLVFLAGLIAIRELPDGKDWLLLTIAATFFSDIGAFLAGRFWPKRHSLPVWLNQRKSYEGIAGGILLALAAVFVLSNSMSLPLTTADIILLGISIGFSAQIGDLLESRLKRIAEVKDSSRILSGQGGILDTIDGLVLSAPTAWLLIQVLAR